MTNNYLKIVTHRQREGDFRPYLVAAFVFFDDRDVRDCTAAVAHARLLADRLRKEMPGLGVQVSVYRRLESHVAIPCLVETAADANAAAIAERDSDLPV
jgi:hypothetical protein